MPEYHDLTGEQIRDLRLSGVEVSSEIRLPRVAYLGDTAPQGLDVFPAIGEKGPIRRCFLLPLPAGEGHIEDCCKLPEAT